MRILITGCNGQLGNEMQLLAKVNPQHEFFFTDVEELDITDGATVDAFVQDNRIDGIVNCAAYTAVDKAEENETLCQQLNATAPGYLAEAINKRGGWMVQVSTDYVFDGTNHTPYKEDEPTCPNSVYGRTKLAGEQNVMTHCKKAMIVRTAWLYSTFGNNFVKTMLRLGREKDSLGVIFDQIGTPTYARDLAVAIMAAVNKGIVPGIYHFSNEGVCSWYDFTKMIAEYSEQTSCDIQPCHSNEFPSPVIRPAYSVLDKTKIKETFGISVPYWTDSLKKCINNIKSI